MISIFVVFPCIGLLPIVDDFSYAPRAWRILLVGFCVGASFILGVTSANLSNPTPHIGHLAGYLGVLRHAWQDILLQSGAYLVVVLPFVYGWEALARGVWDQVRRFSAPSPTSVRVRDLLLIVASVGLLGGIVRFVMRLDPDCFNRPFFRD
jgi:hypothetical protein